MAFQKILSSRRSFSLPVPAALDRIWLLDELRGFAILCMVLYHGVYSAWLLFGIDFPLFSLGPVRFLQQLFAGGFILISGMACRLSRSNLRRGLFCLACAGLVSAATLLFFPSQPIYFGILHLLGCGMLLFALLRPALDRCAPLPLVVLLVFFFALAYSLPDGWIGLPGLSREALPALPGGWWRFPLGLGPSGIFSADYFPLLPWLFLFLAGSVLGVPLREGRFPGIFYRQHSRFLSWAGRRTLWIYLLHQPVLIALLWLAREVSKL